MDGDLEDTWLMDSSCKRSSSLLYVEVSLARIFQSALKTDGCAMTGSAHGTITEFEGGRVDVMGYVGFCYPTFTVFNVLDHRDILVI
jgi:hypothetical protein